MITQEDFNSLYSIQKHAYVDQKMCDRIKLSYHQALTVCRSVIDSDEKLSEAFRNFQEVKKQQLSDNLNKDVLRGVFVDKFKERIFFVVGKGANNYFVYDIPSAQLLKYADMFGNTIDNLPLDLSNIKTTEFEVNRNKTYEKAWRESRFIQHIYNDVVLNDNFSQEQYISDNHYQSIIKNFKSLNDIKEENFFLTPSFLYSVNPAHSTIDPDDLINHQKTNFTKNARNG